MYELTTNTMTNVRGEGDGGQVTFRQHDERDNVIDMVVTDEGTGRHVTVHLGYQQLVDLTVNAAAMAQRV